MEDDLKSLSPMKRTSIMGRPEYWTQERIEKICDRLEEWSNKEDAISMTEFRSQEELTMRLIVYLKEKSIDFAERYDLAKQKVANRISKNAGKGVHPIHYNRYISLYDSELQQHDMAMASIKATAASQSRAEEVQKGFAIVDRFESLTQKDS